MKNQNEVQVQMFENSAFGTLRTMMIDDEPWFIGKDICEIFGDKNSSRSIGRVDDMDKRLLPIIDSLGRKQNAIFVNESGLYSLLFAMQPQKAHHNGVSDEYPIEVQERIEKLHLFKHWVTSKVLPSIRKTGGYVIEGREQEFINSNATIYKELQELRLTVTALQNQLTTTPTPDRYTQNIWKKRQSTPSMDKLAETLNMNEADVYDLVYEYMRSHFGFEPAVAIREYCDKYHLDTTSTITAISDNVVYRTLFALSINSIFSKCGSEYSCVDGIDNSTISSDDTNVSVESYAPIHFSKNDSYDYIVTTLSEMLNDNSRNHNTILRKIYSKMATKQAWRNSMTRWKCTTKKALIEKNEKYRSRFVKVCNEFLEEKGCELFG